MDIFQKLEQLKRNLKVNIPDIVVGITPSVGSQTYEGEKGARIIDVAKWMEYGVPGHIPPRPFMEESKPELKALINKAVTELVESLQNGENPDVENWAHLVGAAAQGIVVKKILNSETWAEKTLIPHWQKKAKINRR